MVVPYADPAANWSFRNAFDEGEYGLGRLTDTLEVGTDAPPHARFFDAVFADDHGKPITVPRAVALYERDGGLLWKHFEYYSSSNDSRRARELVLFSLVTIGNYDYGFNWIFRQDGTLELQAVLTGIMLTKGVHAKTVAAMHGTPAASDRSESNGEHEGRFWHLVAPNVAAVHHQHFFNFRLDFDVDGAANAVREINTRALPAGPDNPSLNAFVMEETALRTEHAARRDLELTTARRWLVVNPEARNSLGQPAAYLLAPGDNSVPYLHPDSPIRRRAGFVNHHFWATAFEPAERNAAGAYPNQSEPGEGLPAWTGKNRQLEGADVVAWYTFGLTHVPRPEEWPVMSATTTGFKLVPVGFFNRNPALDVPKR
jgi:primary-amine oxidase